MAKKLLRWLQETAANASDPNRESRLEHHTQVLLRELARQRNEFDFEAVAAQHSFVPNEIARISQLAFQVLIERAWDDGVINSAERRDLRWVAQSLRIPPADAAKLFHAAGIEHFQQVLASPEFRVSLETTEMRSLQAIAQGLELRIDQICKDEFKKDIHNHLLATFQELTAKGTLERESWDDFCDAAKFIGWPKHELTQLLRKQTRSLIEHTLSEATYDEHISDDEERMLRWMLDELDPDDTVARHVQHTIRTIRFIENAREGRLPTIKPPDLQLRAGQLAHYVSRVRYTHTRHLKSGPRSDVANGLLCITDHRAIFYSPLKSIEFNHRRVIKLDTGRRSVYLRVSKPGEHEFNPAGELRILSTVWKVAVAKVNQTIVENSSEQRSRHIPRDVRQRVWQKYGGQCVECGDSSYLEFDHIIPFSKGGSNSDNNIQLLCRNCNLSKSDLI